MAGDKDQCGVMEEQGKGRGCHWPGLCLHGPQETEWVVPPAGQRPQPRWASGWVERQEAHCGPRSGLPATGSPAVAVEGGSGDVEWKQWRGRKTDSEPQANRLQSNTRLQWHTLQNPQTPLPCNITLEEEETENSFHMKISTLLSNMGLGQLSQTS